MKIKISIFLIYIFLAISCKREKSENEPIVLHQEQKEENVIAEGSGGGNKSSAINNDQSGITLNPSASDSSSNQNSKIMPEIAVNRNNLLYEQNKDIVTPEDFEIGQLLIFSGKPGEEAKNKSYRDFVNRFFYELRKDNIPSSMILQENLFFLTNIFDSYMEKGQIPDKIRIGKVIRIKDEDVRLNLRMFKGRNRTEGKIILLERNNSLKVKEFYGDLGILDEKYSRGNEKFEPEIYKF